MRVDAGANGFQHLNALQQLVLTSRRLSCDFIQELLNLNLDIIVDSIHLSNELQVAVFRHLQLFGKGPEGQLARHQFGAR